MDNASSSNQQPQTTSRGHKDGSGSIITSARLNRQSDTSSLAESLKGERASIDDTPPASSSASYSSRSLTTSADPTPQNAPSLVLPRHSMDQDEPELHHSSADLQRELAPIAPSNDLLTSTQSRSSTESAITSDSFVSAPLSETPPMVRSQSTPEVGISNIDGRTSATAVATAAAAALVEQKSRATMPREIRSTPIYVPVIHEPTAKHSRPSMARVHSELLPSRTPSRTPSPNLSAFNRHHRHPVSHPHPGLSPLKSSASLHNHFPGSGSHSQYSTSTDLRSDSISSLPASSPVMGPNVLTAVDARLRESSRQRAIASQSSSSSLRPPRRQSGSGANSSRASSVAPVITHQSVLQSSDAIISREQLYDILNRDDDDDGDDSENAARGGGPGSFSGSQTRLGRPRPGFASSDRHSSQSSRRNSNSSSSLASGSGIELTSRGQHSSASTSTLARPAMARESTSRMSRHKDLSSTTMASKAHHHHDNYSTVDLDTTTIEKSDWLRRKNRTSRKWRGICCGVGIFAFIAIITGIVLGFVTRKGKVDGLATPPDPEKPTSNKPMPPITQFTPNPNLHKAFYGIDYNPAKALLPWCGVTLQNVVDDMILISQLTNRIRLYGMDCSQADLTFQAISALNLNRTMKVVLTLWVDKDPVTYQRQYDTLLRVLDTYGTDMVQGISVGNEVLFRGDMSISSLGEMMNTVRSTVKTRYNKAIPVFTSEIGNNLNASLAAISDELSGNFHPYFAGTGVDEAAKWTMLQYNNTLETNPTSRGLKGAISEVGWPSAPASAVYMTYAVPGLANLQTMIDTFICQANAAGIPYYWFEFQDAWWKSDPKVPVEPYWGIFDKEKGLKIKVPTCIAP